MINVTNTTHTAHAKSQSNNYNTTERTPRRLCLMFGRVSELTSASILPRVTIMGNITVDCEVTAVLWWIVRWKIALDEK